ncbi:MAG: mercury methylation ferredoxin HgcB [Spirochaetia bacterium]
MRYLKDVVTLEFDPERCSGCGMCIEVCPHEVFVPAGEIVEVQERDRCIECGACMINCASGAIRVQAGVGCAAAILDGIIRNKEPSCDCSSAGCCS